MVDTLLAQKKDMRQVWTVDGRRVPVTQLYVGGNTVVRLLQSAAEGENGDTTDAAVRAQLGFGAKKFKNMAQPQRKQFEKAGIQTGKRVFFEATVENSELTAGQELNVQDTFQPGDRIKLMGLSKGRGFTGVVKRWGFAGGPRTHGQSDRERAPGSIGAGTTPGRVWPRQKMAGRSGSETITLENVRIIAINPATQTVWVSGTIPGAYNSFIRLQKQTTGEALSLTDESYRLLDITPAQEATASEADDTASNQENA